MLGTITSYVEAYLALTDTQTDRPNYYNPRSCMRRGLIILCAIKFKIEFRTIVVWREETVSIE